VGQSRAADDRIATKGGLIMAQLISRFSKDETAATAVEYSLLAGGIALAIVGVVQALGTQVKIPFTTMSTALK
jgi:pilus assembly protein Flp/PilA